jgi:hypothetical protein
MQLETKNFSLGKDKQQKYHQKGEHFSSIQLQNIYRLDKKLSYWELKTLTCLKSSSYKVTGTGKHVIPQ